MRCFKSKFFCRIGSLFSFFMMLFLLGLVLAYRYSLSFFFAGNCRFFPGCSQYAKEALQRHGWLRGGALAFLRILRCQPWGGSGLDEVPQTWTGWSNIWS